MKVEIEVPEGYTVFPYFVKDEDVAITIECYASKTEQVFETDEKGLQVLDDGGNPIPTLSDAERARIAVCNILNPKVVKYQNKKRNAAALISGETKVATIV